MSEQIHITRQNIGEKTTLVSPVGVVTPDYIGQQIRNTSNGDLWISIGSGNSDWKLVGFDSNLIHYSEKVVDGGKHYYAIAKRTVVTGLKCTFEIDVTSRGLIPVTINDVIPQNFLNKKWFKINRLTTFINDIYQTTHYAPRIGTLSCNTSTNIITGTGTEFLTDYRVGDRIGTGSYPNGSTLLGIVSQIVSDTQIILQSNSLSNISNGNCLNNKQTTYPGFFKVKFNDLINSSDSTPYTVFFVNGYNPGVLQQFDDTMGTVSPLPPTDVDVLGGFEYVEAYRPKDLTAAPLNFEYLATGDGGSFPSGCLEGSFKIILDGYLL